MNRRRSPLACLIILLATLPVGCRLFDDAPSGGKEDPVLPATAEPVTGACADVDALATGDLSGEQTFDLTSRCVFNRDVHEIRIRILSETFTKVLDDGCADRDSGYGHVQELIIDGHRIPDVGIKVRGNTSKCNPKRQFRFKFDAKKMFSVWQGQVSEVEVPTNDDRRAFGLEGLSVRASANDPTMARERISSRLFTHANELASTTRRGGLVYRVAFAKLFVSYGRTLAEGPEGSFNRPYGGHFYDYKGLYSLAEHVDEVFLKTRFQVGDAKLKNFYLYQADMARGHFDRASYTREGWSQELVDGKDPKSEADLVKGEEKLFSLFDVLNAGSSDDAIAAAVDLDSFVNYTAGAELTGHWDSLLTNRNNDYLLFDGDAGRWRLITWDLDNSLGTQRDQYDFLMGADLYNPAKVHRNRVFDVLFAPERTAFRARLRDRVRGFLNGAYSRETLTPMVDQLRDTVFSAVEPWEGVTSQSYDDLKSFLDARRREMTEQVAR